MPEVPDAPRWKRIVARWLSFPPLAGVFRIGLAMVVGRHRLGAVVVLFDQHRRVLLVEHVFHPNDPWGLPGGWIRRGEDPQQAARRELLEETNLDAEIGPRVHLERIPRPWHIGIAHVGWLRGGELRLGAELLDARWADPNDLPDGLSPFVRRAVAAAAELVDPDH